MFNLSLRKKIFLSYLVLFTVFVALMFPFSNYLVKQIIIQSMDDQVTELIDSIKDAPDHEELVKDLKAEKPLIFFRVGIITDENKILYDTHMKRVIGAEFSQDYVVDHPEVNEAFEYGTGYSEDYSGRLGQKFAYFAKTFDFHGKTYVLRTAFPFQHIEALLIDFEIGFLTLGSLGLLLFSIVTWFAIHRLTRPIENIIEAIRPYQEGRSPTIPAIEIHTTNPQDEFGRLALTLNSLSEKVRRQIDQLVEERNEKEAILQSLGEGVVAVDRNMHVTYVNTMALQLLNLRRSDLVGFDFSVSGQEACEKLLKECHQEDRPAATSIQLKNGGQSLFLDLMAVPIRGKHGMILVLQDKTEHHKIAQMRKDFVDNASHELKTPITIMLGYAETIDDNPEMPKEMLKKIAGTIMNNARRMNNVIQDLLILSDVENLPESRLDEVELEALINQSRDTVMQVFKDATIRIENKTGNPALMHGDQYLLELAFNNLINNAAKYSEGAADISVAIEDFGDYFEISVADKGIGIPEEDLENLFQRFYTVDKAHSRKKGGSGLGLSIVQTIAEKHFGTVHVKSKLGEGSVFVLTLPKFRERKA
ncbi:MAG: PAS domain-containing protein [Chlamydiia bacterium]|nr:PAS domain-containing protein [Chlamydiia bacterium]